MPQADVIFHNGKVLTVDGRDSITEAVALHGNKILALGPSPSIMRRRAASTRMVDLEGRVLLPGFIDAHVHLEVASLALGLAVSCHSPPHESIDDILETLFKHKREVPPGQWIRAQGSLFPARLKEKRNPTRWDLDKLGSGHPIVFKTSIHMVVLNSVGLERCGISRGVPDPPGGIIE